MPKEFSPFIDRMPVPSRKVLGALGVAGALAEAGALGMPVAGAEAKLTAPISHNIQYGNTLTYIGKEMPSAQDLLAAYGGRNHQSVRGEAPVASAASNELMSNEPIPETAKKLIRYNAAWIEGLRCSGYLLRNDKEQVVGVRFVAHCGVMPNQAHRYLAANGKTYMEAKKPFELKTGSHYTKSVGVIDKINAPNDYTQETVLASVKGHSMKEAQLASKKLQMTRKELAELRVGYPVYSAGRPVDAPENERHATVGHVATFGKAATSEGTFDLNTLYVLNTANKDRSGPGPGYSGSGVLVRIPSTGKYKLAGNVFGVDDFKGNILLDPSQPANSAITLPGEITSASAIDIDPPGQGKQVTELHLVSSIDKIKLAHPL
jgi:hypothetical protein